MSRARTLAARDEAERHWLRRTLPPGTPVVPRWPLCADDLRDFLLAYCACFMAVSTFLL